MLPDELSESCNSSISSALRVSLNSQSSLCSKTVHVFSAVEGLVELWESESVV